MLSTYERSVYIGQKFIVLQIQNGQDYIDVFDANKARFRKMESPSLVHQVLHRQPNFKIFFGYARLFQASKIQLSPNSHNLSDSVLCDISGEMKMILPRSMDHNPWIKRQGAP